MDENKHSEDQNPLKDKLPKKELPKDKDEKKDLDSQSSDKEEREDGKFDAGIGEERPNTLDGPDDVGNPLEEVEHPTLNSSYGPRADWFSFGRVGDPTLYTEYRKQALIAADKIRYLNETIVFSGAVSPSRWLSIGPRNINGRVKCLKIHPTDPNIVYAGTASGWVWITKDSGRNWEPFEEDVIANTPGIGYENMVPSIGSIDLEPSQGGMKILIGTGEAVNSPLNEVFHNFAGNGVFYSDGIDWHHFAYPPDPNPDGLIFRFRTITKVLFCNDNLCDFFVAGPDGLYGVKNIGSGQWELLLSGVITDIAKDPADPKQVFACRIGDSDLTKNGLYKYVGIGDFEKVDLIPKNIAPEAIIWNWAKIALINITGDVNKTNIVLKLGSEMYSCYMDGDMYITPLLGADNSPVNGPRGGSYGWSSSLAIKPQNTGSDFTILAGTVTLKKYTGNFATPTDTGLWQDVGPLAGDIHDDQQMLEFSPSSTNIVYLANDAGIYKSVDSGDTWKKVSNGLIITQFYAMGNWKDYGTVLGGGSQDTGSIASQGGLTWKVVDDDTDGGYVLFDSRSPHHIFVERQQEQPKRYKNGATVLGDYIDISTDVNALFIPCGEVLTSISNKPWIRVLSQSYRKSKDATGLNGDTYFTGDKRVYRLDFEKTDNQWTPISGELATTAKSFISAIAISEQDPEVMYVGTGNVARRLVNPGNPLENAKIYYYDKAQSTDCIDITGWEEIAEQGNETGHALVVNQPVTDIVVNPSNSREIYVSLGWNYAQGSIPTGLVYKREQDTGDPNKFRWVNLTGTTLTKLPTTSVNALAIHPSRPDLLYAGTDIGVFVMFLSTPGEWLKAGRLMPISIVTDLRVDRRTNSLFASTFGRGIYRIYVGFAPKKWVYLRSNNLDTGENLPIPTGEIDPLTNRREVSYRQSPDIKVLNQTQYNKLKVQDGITVDIDGIEFDKATDDEIFPNETYHVLVQAHNRGWKLAKHVKVSLFAGQEGELPLDYHDVITLSQNGNWTQLGPVHNIDELEANKPFILEWQWTSPPEELNYYDFFAIIRSEGEDYTNKQTNPKILAETDRKAAFKRLGEDLIVSSPQTCDDMSEPTSFKDFLKKNQGILYGVVLTLAILTMGRYVLYSPAGCCGEQKKDERKSEIIDKSTVDNKLPPNSLTGGVRRPNCNGDTARIIISIDDLTVGCEDGVDCFQRYDNKIQIISHKEEYDDGDQGAVDMAYLGYALCDGTVPGFSCNEPPPRGDQFGPSTSSGFDYEGGNPFTGDLLAITNNDPLLFYNPCLDRERDLENDPFITICLLEFDYDSVRNYYLGGQQCTRDFFQCRDKVLPLECPGDHVGDLVTWEDNMNVARFTVKTVHSDERGGRHTYYITILKTNNGNKIFRIAYNNPKYLENRIVVQGGPQFRVQTSL